MLYLKDKLALLGRRLHLEAEFSTILTLSAHKFRGGAFKQNLALGGQANLA